MISYAFQAELDKISVNYNFDLGDELEISICDFLRKFLPQKYGVCRGFVVNKDGEKAGDDIIIYDQEQYPTLRILDIKDDYSRKQEIPVEAVCAYIEVKHRLDSETLKKAIKQVVDVKRICYSRFMNPRYDISKNMHIFDNEVSKKEGWDPIIANPVYGMIFSAKCVDLNNSVTDIGEKSTEFLVNELNRNDKKEVVDIIHQNKHFSPDSIIAGPNTTGFCGHYIFDDDGKIQEGVLLTKFYTGVYPGACYQINTHEGMAFGLAICHIMMVLNFIRLKEMPWDRIFNTAKMPNCEERNAFERELKEKGLF